MQYKLNRSRCFLQQQRDSSETCYYAGRSGSTKESRWRYDARVLCAVSKERIAVLSLRSGRLCQDSRRREGCRVVGSSDRRRQFEEGSRDEGLARRTASGERWQMETMDLERSKSFVCLLFSFFFVFYFSLIFIFIFDKNLALFKQKPVLWRHSIVC